MKLASEFTSGQLIIAICMFLVVALICFSLGVVVGKYEAGSSRSMQVRASNAAVPMPPGPRRLEPPSEQEGVQKSPRPAESLQQKPAPPGFPSSPAASPNRKVEPRVSELPAPPATPSTPPISPGMAPAPSAPSAVPAATSQAPLGAALSAEHPAPTNPVALAKQPGEEKAAPVSPAPSPPTAPVSPARPTAPVTTPPSVPAPSPGAPQPGVKTAAPGAPPPAGATQKTAAPAGDATGKGTYTIQVASFSGAKRKENAESFRKRLEANAGLQADIVPSEDDKMARVFIGNYPDRETAVKACEELKKRAGFAGSFIKRR